MGWRYEKPARERELPRAPPDRDICFPTLLRLHSNSFVPTSRKLRMRNCTRKPSAFDNEQISLIGLRRKYTVRATRLGA